MITIIISLGLLIIIVGIAILIDNKEIPQIKVNTIINADIAIAFNYIVPVDLSHIFKKHKFIAGITNTSIKEGWTKPGLKRIVYFDDGSTAKESLLTVVPNTSFSYRIEDFTSQLKFLAKQIEGNWMFTNLGNEQTKIEWTYKIVPRNFISKGIVKLVLINTLKGLLNKALTILKDDLENNNLDDALLFL